MDERPHLRDLPIDGLAERFRAAGVPKPEARARRAAVAVHKAGALTWERSGLGRSVRRALDPHFRLEPLLTPVGDRVAEDGARKWMFRVAGGETIESVLIPNRGNATLCVSSQAGCAMGCTFCATASLGLRRNLTAGEITEALVHVERASGRRVTDVVFMGMGEPLHNYDAVMTACANLNHDRGPCIARKRMNLSTVGLVPAMRRFAAEERRWRLYLSLHSAVQETRERLVPLARVHPLPEVLDAAREVQRRCGPPFMTVQYVALPELNMDAAHVEALRTGLAGLRVILNVIPWNDTGAGFRAPTWDEVRAFTTRLRSLGCPVKIRYSAGKRAGMGCGQLAAETAAPVRASGHMAAPAGIFTG